MVESQTVGGNDASKDELQPGHTLMHGQYTIDGFLNAGGFGITYVARDSLGRKVVIKECFPGAFCRRTATSVNARSRTHTKEFSNIVRSFIEEAHGLAKLEHPNVVGVHQVFEENKTAYMVLDFVEGRDLLNVIEEQNDPLDPGQVETLLRKLLDAIRYIHDQGMLHRDISPDNILLTPNVEPILIDFGAARHEIDPEDRVLSEMRVIKDGYSPQEFYVSGAEQGTFSDIYALAATFYHVVTGGPPANAQSRLAAVAGGEGDPYDPVAGRIGGYSEPFLRGIDQALEILPKNRIQSAELWLDLLDGRDSAGQTTLPVPSSDSRAIMCPPTSEPTSKTKARALAAIGLAVPILGGAGFLLMGGGAPTPEETASALANADATLTTTAADPTLASVSGPSEDATTATELAAALNISSVTSQPETGSRDDADLASSAVPAPAPGDNDLASALGLTSGGATEPAANAAPAPTSGDDDIASVLGLTSGPDANPASAAAPAPTSSDDDIASVLGLTLGGATDPAPDVIEVALDAAATGTTQSSLIESFDLPRISSAWTVDLTGVLPDGTDRIFAIDGRSLDNEAEIDTVLHQMMQAPAGGTLELAVLAGESADAAVVEIVTVPVIHRTVFVDGPVFETRMEDGTWTTVVADAPAGSEFEIEDVVVGDLSTEVLFNKRTSLPEALVQASAENVDWLSLAVRRQGDTLVSGISIPR